MTQKKRRLFSTDQQAEALRIIEQVDKPVSQIAKELGIGVNSVHTWIRQSKIDRQRDPKEP